MNRPVQPHIKEALLNRCLEVAVEDATLGASLANLAARIGTSARMLVYHFDSKEELERRLIEKLEHELRDKLWSFSVQSGKKPVSLSQALQAMWAHLTAPQMLGLLKLAFELNHRAIGNDTVARNFIEQENQRWIASLVQLLGDKQFAQPLFHLFQGATLDYLSTGNRLRGQRSIETFLKMMGK